MAKFSIIIPVYNIAPYLRECLDSVLAQTCVDWEAICVDDGSTDGSGAILDEYAAKDARFKVVHQVNSGVSVARNAGLSLAQGCWLWFVDGDDAIHPQALNWLKELFALHPDGDAYLMNMGELMGYDVPKAWPNLLDVESVERIVTRNSKVMHGFRRAAWAAVVKREKLGELRFPNLTMGEDVVFHMTYFWNTRTWLYKEEPLYFYRNRDDSAANSKPSAKKVEDLLTCESIMLEMFQRNACRWSALEAGEYLKWNRDFVWYTFMGMFFSLANREMEPLVTLWVKVQLKQHSLYSDNLWRRLIVQVLNIAPKSWLCRFLVVGIKRYAPKRVLNKLRRMCLSNG